MVRVKKTSKIEFNNADNAAKEFYFHLGVLSTKFAVLEYNFLQLLGRLITDDFVLTNTVLERNSLSQNIELLKKINRYRKFEETRISTLVAEVSEIRSVRNLFIHGVWGVPIEQKNDWEISCTEPKLAYEENERGRQWSSGRHHGFRLSDIKRLVDKIDALIQEQVYLFNRLDEVAEQF